MGIDPIQAWWDALADTERETLLAFDLTSNTTAAVFALVARPPRHETAVRWEDGPWQVPPDVVAFIDKQRSA
jgi:hypothetical protein